MRRRDGGLVANEATVLEQIVLLCDRGGVRFHGWVLGSLCPGMALTTVYRALERFEEDRGLLRSEFRASGPGRSGPPRRVYEFAEGGRVEAERLLGLWFEGEG